MNPHLREEIGGSFRDPSGMVFKHQGELLRQINRIYQDDYDLLIKSGLYDKLTGAGLLIPHEEVTSPIPTTAAAYKTIKPVLVPFISYPYEWSFSQLKDAALTTLTIQKHALNHGMSLKDASAYNIQFYQGKPILIDTLSFEAYLEGKPWVAYRQFCQFFLAPLALMSYKNIMLGRLLLDFIDGIPLDLTSQLLPWRSWLRVGLFINIHLHRLVQRRTSDNSIESYVKNTRKRFSKESFLGLLDSLFGAIQKFKWGPKDSKWSEYYESGLYSPAHIDHKKMSLTKFLDLVQPRSVWDLGANTGIYSRICAAENIPTVSFDLDPLCVERNYLECKERQETNILPLLLDLANPSPAIGWMHQERFSLVERGPADMVVALALVHHLAISNNLPLEKIASFFHACSRWAVIEFVPKDDPQVQKLLRFRQDIFPEYTQAGFEQEFSKLFKIIESIHLNDSPRTLYLLEALN
jgi:hypothetical protein